MTAPPPSLPSHIQVVRSKEGTCGTRTIATILIAALVLLSSPVLDPSSSTSSDRKDGGSAFRTRARHANASQCVLAQRHRMVGEVRRDGSPPDFAFDEDPDPTLPSFTIDAPAPPGGVERPVALCVAIHPPKYPQAVQMLEERHKVGEAADWDIIFVYSTEEDRAAHESYLANIGRPHLLSLLRNHLLLSEWMDATTVRRFLALGKDFFPTVKKYFGVALLSSCYESVVILDADVHVIRPWDVAASVRRRIASGYVFGGMLRGKDILRSITCSSLEWLTQQMSLTRGETEGLAAAIVLKNLTRDCLLYTWYSDIPAVRSNDAQAFLWDIDFPHSLPPSWRVFDALVYELWKLWRREYTLVDLDAVGLPLHAEGSLESMLRRSEYDNVVRAFPPGPSWISYSYCLENRGACGPSSTSSADAAAVTVAATLAFHVDRVPG
jgi:hypothetical protein